MNTSGWATAVSPERAKLNMASWFRKSAHLRDPAEIANAIQPNYDFLIDCVYRCNFEAGMFYKFITQTPQEVGM